MNETAYNNMISYLYELKERYDVEERERFWKDVVGFTDEEIVYFELLT